MNNLTEYIVNSKMPPPTPPGICCLCGESKKCVDGLRVKQGVYDDKNYRYCSECSKKISDYDNTYYG